MQFRQLILPAVALLAGPVAAQATLTHLYTFNDGTANDSVGGANGTLMTTAANGELPTITGGQLVFDPAVNNGLNTASGATGGQYVSLPSNILAIPTFTMEVWATERANTPWQRLYDSGNYGGGNGFEMFATYGYNGNGEVGQLNLNSTDAAAVTGNEASLNTEHLFTWVFNNGSTAVYLDGTFLTSSIGPSQNPANSSFADAWIGRSNFTADPYFDGSIDEMRVYNTVLPATQIASDFATGPTPVPEPAAISVLAAGAGLVSRRRRS